jgi:hypothetical protein
VASCKTQLETEPPVYHTQDTKELKNVSSFISIPIEIPFSTINQKLNNEFVSPIYEDLTFDDGDDLMVKISLYDKITVSGISNVLSFNTPLDIWAKVRWSACSICPEFIKESSFKLNLKFLTSVTAQPDWILATKTMVSSYDFKESPMIDLGPVKVNIKSFVEVPLRKELPNIAAMLDKEAASFLNIKPQIEEVWRQIQTPYLTDEDYKAWTAIQPLKFLATQPVCDNEKLILRLGLRANIFNVFGEKPDLRQRKLADLEIVEKLNPEFKINLNAFISYNELTRQAMQNYKDTVLVFGKRKVKIEDIDIYGKNAELFVKTKVSGSATGILFLRGTPAIDTLRNSIYIKNLDFDYNTKKIIHKTASWLLQGTIRKLFEQNMMYQLNDDIKYSRTILENYLKDYNYMDIVRLKGKVGKMQLEEIQAEDRGISARFYVDGNIAAKILKLDL